MGLFQNIYEGYQQEVLKEEAIIVAYQEMVEKIKKMRQEDWFTIYFYLSCKNKHSEKKKMFYDKKSNNSSLKKYIKNRKKRKEEEKAGSSFGFTYFEITKTKKPCSK